MEWATPTSCTDVRRFVGLVNYYRKFVLRFSALAAPLTALCSPRAQFTWGPAEQQSFDALKAALTSAPVLRVWDPARPTRLLTDASELAVLAILEKPDDAGAFHPVAFESRKLTQPERFYPPHLLELLAPVHAFKSLPGRQGLAAALPARQALQAAHGQCALTVAAAAVAAAAAARQSSPGALAKPAGRVSV